MMLLKGKHYAESNKDLVHSPAEQKGHDPQFIIGDHEG